MTFITRSAVIGALALIGLSAAGPASAMPTDPLATVTADVSSTASGIEQVRWHRRYVTRRYFAPRRGWHHGYRRPGPIRRFLRHL